MDRASTWLFGLAIVATGAFALSSYDEWPGQWPWTIDSITGTTVLTGPLVAALGAGVQLTAARLDPVAEASPRGWLVPFRSAAAALAVGSVAYLVTGVGAVAVTLSFPHGGPIEWWAPGIGLLVLAVCALAGAVAAAWAPARITVVAAAPIVFLLGTFGPSPLPDLLRHGPSTGSLAGLQLDLQVFGAQAAGLVAAGACLAVAALPWREPVRRAARTALATGAAVALASALLVLDQVGSERFTPSAERPTQCAGETVLICLSPSSTRYLDATAGAAQAPAHVLVEAGIGVPEAYDEELPYQEGDPDHGILVRLETDEPTFRDGASLLTRPAPCPAWSDPDTLPPSSAFDAEQLLVEWMVARHEDQPTAVTDDWARATFGLLRSCRLDAIVLP